MSTHNIGFYEDLKKIIFQLSSNIIKYAPYLIFCINLLFLEICLQKNLANSTDPDQNVPIRCLLGRICLKT